MNVIDFTHVIEPAMPVFPGTDQPRLERAFTVEKDGFQETALHLYSHHGTHMDAPAHVLAAGETLDRMAAAHFVGTALVIDCSDAKPGTTVGMTRIEPLRNLADEAEFLLLHTGWDRFWGRPEYFDAYPVIGPDVADYLVASGKKGIGMDTISVDPMGGEALALHKQLLGAGMVVIENLTGLEKAKGGLFTFCALPLHYREADGAPVRAIGILG